LLVRCGRLWFVFVTSPLSLDWFLPFIVHVRRPTSWRQWNPKYAMMASACQNVVFWTPPPEGLAKGAA